MNPTVPPLFSLGLLLAGLAAASAATKPANPPEPMVRAQVEFIEVSGGQLDELLFGEEAPTTDSALREQVGKLVAAKQAAIVETLAASARFGGKGTAESVREQIYPTEWENPETPEEVRGGGKDGKPALGPRDFAVGYMPSAWDTRDVGSVLEIEPQFENDDGTFDLQFDAEMITYPGTEVWAEWRDRFGDASVRMARFHSIRCYTSIRIRPGKPLLAAVVSPEDPDGRTDPTRKLMVFVKCDRLIPAAKPPPPAADQADGESRRPRLIRSEVEFIALPHALFTGLMAGPFTTTDDNPLHERVAKLIETGDAQMVEAMMATAKSGGEGKTATAREFIYATEYEPPELPNVIDLADLKITDKASLPLFATCPMPSAWDTRYLGPSLVVKPEIDDSTGLLRTKVEPELVEHTGFTVWRDWEDARGRTPVRMPDMFRLRIFRNETVTAPGEWFMAAALTPRDAKGYTDPTRKVMVFVKHTLLTPGQP